MRDKERGSTEWVGWRVLEDKHQERQPRREQHWWILGDGKAQAKAKSMVARARSHGCDSGWDVEGRNEGTHARGVAGVDTVCKVSKKWSDRFDDGLNMGKEVKENTSRMTPGFLRAGWESARCLYAGGWFWTILSLKGLWDLHVEDVPLEIKSDGH